MKRVTGLALGVLAGIVGFAVFAEMSGRVVIASGRATFDVIRDRLGSGLSLLPLGALTLVNALTLVVQLYGMALAVQLLTKVPYRVWVPLATVALVVVLWRAGFELLDNSGALCGLVILVAVVAAIKLGPDTPRHVAGASGSRRGTTDLQVPLCPSFRCLALT